MEYKMKSVENLPDGRYVVNEHIIIENVVESEKGKLTYDIDYDDTKVSEEYAIKVSEDFILKSIKSMAIANYEEQTEQYYQG
jgi:hypothetical protein